MLNLLLFTNANFPLFDKWVEWVLSIVNIIINSTICVMKPIVQEDSFGCGVACVANILDITYLEALELFEDGQLKASTIGFYCKDILRVFEYKNIKYEYKYIKPKLKKKIYKDKVIVFLKRSKKYPAGHYLCRINNKWLDSWINFPNENKKSGFRKRLPGKSIYLISPV